MRRNYQFEVTGRLESFRNSFMTSGSRCKNVHCQRDFFFIQLCYFNFFSVIMEISVFRLACFVLEICGFNLDLTCLLCGSFGKISAIDSLSVGEILTTIAKLLITPIYIDGGCWNFQFTDTLLFVTTCFITHIIA